MTTRTQYLLFLSIWIAAIAVCAFAGVNVKTKGDLTQLALLAFLPAAGGFLVIRKCQSIIDNWRLRHGRDVYQERKYEDDGGFIHLNPVPAIEQQHDVSIREIASELREASDSENSHQGPN